MNWKNLLKVFKPNYEIPLKYENKKLIVGKCKFYDNCKNVSYVSSLKEIKKDLRKKKGSITITGNEPLLIQDNKNFIKLLKWLNKKKFFIIMETTGSEVTNESVNKYVSFFRIYIRIDMYPNSYVYKSATSIKGKRVYFFNVSNFANINSIYNFIKGYNLFNQPIYLMPVETNPSLSTEYIEKVGLQFFNNRKISVKYIRRKN